MEKVQISIETFHKLNRSHLLTSYIHLNLNSRPVENPEHLYFSLLFRYLKEDIAEIINELKALGLCDKWIKQSKHAEAE